MISLDDERTVQCTDEDLEKSLLEHYQQLSDQCCHFASGVPLAIKFYFKYHRKVESLDVFLTDASAQLSEAQRRVEELETALRFLRGAAADAREWDDACVNKELGEALERADTALRVGTKS